MATGETIAAQIADINASKAALIAAIKAKGVTVPQGAKLADLAALVAEISGGEGYASFQDDPQFWNMGAFTGPIKWPEDIGLNTGVGVFAGSSIETLEIPEGVLRIDECAFACCYFLTSVTIPSSVNIISEYAFYDCNKLESVDFSHCTPISLREGAFKGCSRLKTLSFPSSFGIGENAFEGCPNDCDVTFAATMAKVQGMPHYPFGFLPGAIFHCSDGDLTVE